MTGLCALPATEQARLVRRREVSPVDLVEASLARIEAVQPVLNAFCFVFPEEARAQAREAEAAVMRGDPLGPLHGLPVAFKDFTPTSGHRTTRGSYCFEHWVADADPVIVRRFKQAGAIIVGKTTTPEFAHSGFTQSPLWGLTGNPWDPARSSGGSSGGSGVAAATGCVALAEGTDMGGSVRIPAALCGCVGLKPSLGRIPMDILPTVYDDMSHFGPLARTIDDAALFLRVAEGPDDADINSQIAPLALPERLDADLTGLRLALSPDLGLYLIDPEVAANPRRGRGAAPGRGRGRAGRADRERRDGGGLGRVVGRLPGRRFRAFAGAPSRPHGPPRGQVDRGRAGDGGGALQADRDHPHRALAPDGGGVRGSPRPDLPDHGPARTAKQRPQPGFRAAEHRRPDRG
ncbi:MAG: amidase, partial [Proteobacteria bacterium]|nr:amidase [Pseudomonadota bacterium]